MDTIDIVAMSCAVIALVVLLGLILYTVTVGCAVKPRPSRDKKDLNVNADGHAQNPVHDNAVHGIDNPGMREIGGDSALAAVVVKADIHDSEEKNGQCNVQTSKL